jgi:hypothetical protein
VECGGGEPGDLALLVWFDDEYPVVGAEYRQAIGDVPADLRPDLADPAGEHQRVKCREAGGGGELAARPVGEHGQRQGGVRVTLGDGGGEVAGVACVRRTGRGARSAGRGLRARRPG